MHDEGMVVMDVDECWSRLTNESLGRLALCAAGEIDIYPVNFVVDNRQLYLRTAPGSKLLELTIQPSVAFEVEPWVPTLKYRWVRITPSGITGRFFTRGPEPERF